MTLGDEKPPVLVTGGAGYIGSHAVLALLEAGFPVVVIDDLSTGYRGGVDRRAVFYEGGIENESLVRGVMEMQRIGAVLHFAGSGSPEESRTNPLKYYRNNTAASRSLIESAVACRVPYFVLCSTAAVYGTAASQPLLAEGAFLWPSDPYGNSSLVTETILADAAAAHGIGYGVLRCQYVAGADPQGRCGPSTSQTEHTVKLAVDAVLGKRESVPVARTDKTADGSVVSDYVHVTDLVAAHVAALQALIAGAQRDFRLNCGYNRGVSALEIVGMVEKITNVRVKRTEVPLPEGEPAIRALDSTALREQLGWVPRHEDLEEIVRSTYRWEMRHPRIIAA